MRERYSQPPSIVCTNFERLANLPLHLLTAPGRAQRDPRGQCNLTPGVPQVSVPGATVNGLPVGLSIVGARGSDAALIAVATALERRG